MKINIGERIKELRRRDGRKQEDLAAAVGVTGQAVSRWEAGGAYPDMELIPSIAHYFHISIDELFGYSEEREEAIGRILAEADKSINALGDQSECIAMLHAAADEYPSEPQILIRLCYALFLNGYFKHGLRAITSDSSDYARDDYEYNAKNEYWQEAASVAEKLLKMDIPQDDRELILTKLIIIYGKIGEKEKASELAKSQNSIFASREILLTNSSGEEESDMFCGEAIIALLRHLEEIVSFAVGQKISVFTSDAGVNLLTGLAHLFETVFSDGNFGYTHLNMRDLYLYSAIYEARFSQDTIKAKEYFDKAYGHLEQYISIRNTGLYHYTAPLVSKVTFPSENFPAIPDDYWRAWMDAFPENLREAVKNDPKYAHLSDR